MSDEGTQSYAGRILIAMPSMSDERFQRSVVYLCAHSSDGAMGLIVNKPIGAMRMRTLLEQLDLVRGGDAITLPAGLADAPVLRGGPVETSRGFVLHSTDYFVDEASLPIDQGVAMTATLDVLRALAAGQGPRSALLALGYAGWGPGQLEHEILANGWLVSAPDADLLFRCPLDERYDRALRDLGVDPAFLSSEGGRA
jgi:putative transcriptional regulator